MFRKTVLTGTKAVRSEASVAWGFRFNHLMLVGVFIAVMVVNANVALAQNWSDSATWGGIVPAAGTDVVIEAGQTVVLDTDVTLKSLTVNGNLSCGNRDVELSAEWIMVHGRFDCGSEDAPFTNELNITLTGTKDGDNIMGMGDKFIGVMGDGVLELHGEVKESWVKMGAQADVGENFITLAEPVDWSVHDQIVITSNRLNPEEAEQHWIRWISSNGRIIRLDKGIAHPRMGQLQTYTRPTDGRKWDVDTRVEVGLLSRNITIQGDASSASTQYGGHIMAMENGRISASGIELYRMGQYGEMGRYPWHWHMLERGGEGQYLKNSSIHQSYNRAIVIHGTWYTLVEDNVAYDHVGHGIMLEDGSEIENTIRGNLALLTRRPNSLADALTPSDFTPYRTRQNASPSTYWITNPNNTFVDNVAAGTEGTGFWFAFPKSPTGASASDPRLKYMQPHTQPLGQFDRNTVHSSFNGLDINDGLNTDHSINANRAWENIGPKVFNDLTFFSNETAIYNGIGSITGPAIYEEEHVAYKGTRISDNINALMFATSHVITDSVIVSYDEAYPLNDIPTYYFMSVYDGPTHVYDTHIVGFNRNDTSLLDNIWAAEKRPNHRFEKITFDHPGVPRIWDPIDFNQTGQRFSSVIYDVDGTLTGRKDSSITPDHPFFATPSDYKPDNWLMHKRTDEHTVLVSFSDKPTAILTRSKADEPDELFYLREVHTGSRVQMPLMTTGEYEYDVRFRQLPGAWIKRFTIETLYPPVDGEAVVMRFLELGRLEGVSVDSARSVDSFTDVRNSTVSAYYADGTDLMVKLYANGPRQKFNVSWTGASITMPDVDSDGDTFSDQAEVANGTDPAVTIDNPFNFDTNGNMERWTTNNVSIAGVNNGIVNAQSTSNDPMLIRTGFGFDGDRISGIAIRIKSSSTMPMELFWGISEDNRFRGTRRVNGTYNTPGEWQIIYFDMRGETAWTAEAVTKLRIDPTKANNVPFEIDKIWLLDRDAFEIDSDLDGDGVSNEVEFSVGRNQFSPTDFDFPFDMMYDWTPNPHIANMIVESGILKIESTGADPQIHNRVFGFYGDNVPQLTVRLKMDVNYAETYLFWGTTSTDSFSKDRKKRVNYTGGRGWQELTFDMSNEPDWMGEMIASLRFDPGNEPDVNIEIDRIYRD